MSVISIGTKKCRWEYDDVHETIRIIQLVSTYEKLFKHMSGKEIIPLDTIESITVYFTDTYKGVGFYAGTVHNIYFRILKKDNTEITFNAYYLRSRDGFFTVVDHLKNKGLKIIDEYQLLEILRDPNIRVWDYIESLKKQ